MNNLKHIDYKKIGDFISKPRKEINMTNEVTQQKPYKFTGASVISLHLYWKTVMNMH